MGGARARGRGSELDPNEPRGVKAAAPAAAHAERGLIVGPYAGVHLLRSTIVTAELRRQRRRGGVTLIVFYIINDGL